LQATCRLAVAETFFGLSLQAGGTGRVSCERSHCSGRGAPCRAASPSPSLSPQSAPPLRLGLPRCRLRPQRPLPQPQGQQQQQQQLNPRPSADSGPSAQTRSRGSAIIWPASGHISGLNSSHAFRADWHRLWDPGAPPSFGAGAPISLVLEPLSLRCWGPLSLSAQGAGYGWAWRARFHSALVGCGVFVKLQPRLHLSAAPCASDVSFGAGSSLASGSGPSQVCGF